MEYLPYHEGWNRPNIVVDSGPRHDTVLTLSHWPSVPTPRYYAGRTSVQSVIRYLTSPLLQAHASVVTASHFDVDAVLSVFALLHPEVSSANAKQLIALAEAGDFCISDDDETRRISVAIAAWGDLQESPLRDRLASLDADARCALTINYVLPKIVLMLRDTNETVGLWRKEEDRYQRSLAYLSSPRVQVTQYEELDLATIVGIEAGRMLVDSNEYYLGLDPFAVHKVAPANTILLALDSFYCVAQRYESWVQFASENTRPRRDLRPLAKWLSAHDTACWTYPGVYYPYPALTSSPQRSSDLPPEMVTRCLANYLATAPPAWSPGFQGTTSSANELNLVVAT